MAVTVKLLKESDTSGISQQLCRISKAPKGSIARLMGAELCLEQMEGDSIVVKKGESVQLAIGTQYPDAATSDGGLPNFSLSSTPFEVRGKKNGGTFLIDDEGKKGKFRLHGFCAQTLGDVEPFRSKNGVFGYLYVSGWVR